MFSPTSAHLNFIIVQRRETDRSADRHIGTPDYPLIYTTVRRVDENSHMPVHTHIHTHTLVYKYKPIFSF